MTDSHEQSYFLERFERVEEMLHEGDVGSAVASLVDLREKGFINKELDHRIDVLRDEPTPDEIEESAEWVGKVSESIRGYGGDIFQMVEELSEAAVGISEAEWIDVDDSTMAAPEGEEDEAAGEPGQSGLGDVDDLADLDDPDAFEGMEDVDGLDDFSDLDEFDDLDDFDDLDEFSDLAEFSDLDEFSGLEGLSDLSEFEEASDAADEDASEVSDVEEQSEPEQPEASESDSSGAQESEGGEQGAGESGDPPSVDFAIIDESPSQVVSQLSQEEIEKAGERFAEAQPVDDGADVEPDDDLDEAPREAGETQTPESFDESSPGEPSELSEPSDESFELSELSEESEESDAQIETAQDYIEAEAAETVDDEPDEDGIDLDFDFDDMDFDVGDEASAEEEPTGGFSDEQPGVSQEILLDDEVDEVPEQAEAVQDVKAEVPMNERATRKHQAPTRPGDKESDSEVDETQGNRTKVAGLDETTSQQAGAQQEDEASESQRPEADFRETRKQQSVDPMAAQIAAGQADEDDDADGEDDEQAPLGAADDGFQLFSDSEAEEMGLSYSSVEEDSGGDDADSVDPFDDDEELDPFENNLGENPFSDDDLFGDVDDEGDEAGEPASAGSGGRRMPDSPSGEARYRGAAPAPPEHRRGSGSGEIETSSGAQTFDDVDPALDDDLGDSGSGSGNQFAREKTQRNESLAEIASSMRSDSSSADLGEESSEEDDFDLGFTNPAEGSRFSGGSISESDADDDFDLGLSNPEQRTSSPADESGEEDDFDLGLSNPEEKNRPSTADEQSEEDDFDLGLSNPEVEQQRSSNSGPGSVVDESSEGEDAGDEVSSTFFGSLAPFQRDESDVSEAEQDADTPSRHRQRDTSNSKPRIRFDSTPTPAPDAPKREMEPTPAGMSAVSRGEEPSEDSIDEDEFFELADSLAQESEASKAKRPKYRGEPLVGESNPQGDISSEPNESDNPFAHEAPTGVQEALRESESSFVLEEIPAEESDGSESEGAADEARLEQAKSLYESGDFESARDLVVAILDDNPDHSGARKLESLIDEQLEQVYRDKLGDFEKTPKLEIDMSNVANLDLDSRAGFLLSQMDGMSTVADLLELSNMSRVETLSVIVDLIKRNVISLS